MIFSAGDIICHSLYPGIQAERRIIEVIHDLNNTTEISGYLWTYSDLELADELDNHWDSRKSDDPLLFWWKINPLRN